MAKPGRYLALILLAACIVAEAGPRSLAGAAEHPAALVVLRDAANVRFSKRGLSDQLTYRVRAKFPASTVIGRISQKLRERGWNALAYDFLGPGSTPSQMRVWQERLAGTTKPWACLQQWIGDWKDSSGNIVRYAFRYRQRCGSRDSSGLEVIALYYPEAAVRQMQNASEAYRKTLKAK